MLEIAQSYKAKHGGHPQNLPKIWHSTTFLHYSTSWGMPGRMHINLFSSRYCENTINFAHRSCQLWLLLVDKIDCEFHRMYFVSNCEGNYMKGLADDEKTTLLFGQSSMHVDCRTNYLSK